MPYAIPQWLTTALPLAAMVLGYQVLWQGLRDILRLRGSLYTLGLLGAVLGLCCSVLYGEESFAPLVVVQLFFLQGGLHNEAVALYYTERTVQSFTAPMGVCNCPQLLENTDSLRRDVGDLDDFRKNFKKTGLPQDVLCLYSMILLPLLPLLSYLLARHSGQPFLHVWLLLVMGAIPCSGVSVFAGPFAALAKRLSNYGGALCAWHGARIFGGKHTVILRDGDLFPRTHIVSNGMKIYGSYPAAQIISYALAAMECADSPLAELFEKLLQEQYGRRSPVTEYRCYDHGGIGAEIKGDIVLVGTLSFMRSMGVHMATGARVRQAVYVSVNGELAAVFAVKYKASASTRTGLHDILANRNFSVVLATRDFLITPELIQIYRAHGHDHFPRLHGALAPLGDQCRRSHGAGRTHRKGHLRCPRGHGGGGADAEKCLPYHADSVFGRGDHRLGAVHPAHRMGCGDHAFAHRFIPVIVGFCERIFLLYSVKIVKIKKFPKKIRNIIAFCLIIVYNKTNCGNEICRPQPLPGCIERRFQYYVHCQ